jgi:hypothetical protein
MGFIPIAFAAGGAEKILEDAKTEREEVKELFDTSARLWTEMGITNLQTNRAKRKEYEKIAEKLQKIPNNQNEYLSKDQIAAVLGQGRGDEVYKTLEKFNSEGYYWSPADIVDMGKNYESTNKTIEQHLNEILGTVKTGTTTYSDALIASQPETLSEKLGLFSSKDYIKKRIDTFGSVLGKDLAELQALAMDDKEFGEYPTAQIKLGLPVLSGLKITMSQLKRDFTDSIARQMGVELKHEYDSASGEYRPVFSKEQAQIQNKVLAAVDKALNDFDILSKTDTDKTQVQIKQGITNNILGNKLSTDPSRYILPEDRVVKTEVQTEKDKKAGKQTVERVNKDIKEIMNTKPYRDGSPIKKQDLILDEMIKQINEGGLQPNVITNEVVKILMSPPFNKKIVDAKNIVNKHLKQNTPKPDLNKKYPENEHGFNLPEGYVPPLPQRTFFNKKEIDKWYDDWGTTHYPSGRPKP